MKSLSRIFVKLAIYTIKGGARIGRGLNKILPRIARPFFFLGRKFGRYFLLPIYKIYIWGKRKVLGIYSPARSKLFLVLTKKYIVHFLVVTLTLFVFVGNINAQEIREEDVGEDTIMFALFAGGAAEIEIVEETAVFDPQEKVLSYLDKSAQVDKTTVVEGGAEVTEEQIAEGLSAVTGGGTAVMKPNITEIEIGEAQRTQALEHVVKEGETISTIAEQYGISTNTVLWANDLGVNSVIKPGSTLRILPISGLEHKVTKGDSLGGIAQEYEIDEDVIIAYNKLSDDGTIEIGQTLVLPGAEKEIPVVVAATPQYGTRPTPSLKNIFAPKPPDSTQAAPRGGMVWPTSGRRITQYYGWRHKGLDVDGHYDSPIYAAEAGTVTTSGWNSGGYGNYVIIDHGGGIVTLYAHLSKLYVTKGQHVGRGETLGMMGTTGWSTGTHLHFEVRVNGSYRNPLSYIK
jgi:murein DD-endopeptidase MepM/ murein hydrolase activator NlpD